MSADGAALEYSTYLSTLFGDPNDQESGTAIAVDSAGMAHVGGYYARGEDPQDPSAEAFVVILSANGTQLEGWTDLTGWSIDKVSGIAVDGAGNTYVTGFTWSTDFPHGIPDGDMLLAPNAFVMKFAMNQSGYLVYPSGSSHDVGSSIAVDSAGSAYVTGYTWSTDFPTRNPYQGYQGAQDAFVLRLDSYAAPAGLASSVASFSSIRLTWTDAATGEQGYEVANGNHERLAVTGPNATSIVLNQAPGTTQSYFVRAFGSEGTSPWAGPIVANNPAAPPEGPSGLYAVARAANQLELRWTDTANNETGFILQRSTNRANWTQILDGSSNTVQFIDTGLNAGATYYYRARAYNTYGASAWSEIATGVVWRNVPSPPAQVRAISISSGQILVVWKDGANESKYRVEAKLEGGSYSQIGQTGADVTTFSHAGLAAGSTWTYRLRASNEAGASAYSNEATGKTLPALPAPPSNLVVSPLSNRVVSVAWADNSTNETEFRLERKQGSASFAQIAIIVANGSSYFDSAVAPNTTYTYRVRAANESGASAPTPPVNGTTPADASGGVLRVMPTAIRFRGVAPGKTADEKLTVSNAGKARLKVVVAQLTAPFAVVGTRTFILKPKEKRALKVRYVATDTSKSSTTTLGVAGSGRKNPAVYVSVSAD